MTDVAPNGTEPVAEAGAEAVAKKNTNGTEPPPVPVDEPHAEGSGEQVAEGASEIADENPSFGLGDTITLIHRDENGAETKRVSGTVYKLSQTSLHILEDGKPTQVTKYTIQFDEEANLTFVNPSDVKGYTVSTQLSEDPLPFATVQNFSVGQELYGYKDGSEETKQVYTIKRINIEGENDKVVFVGPEGEELEVNFEYYGIPDDLPFDVLFPKASPAKDLEPEAETEAEEPINEDDLFAALGFELVEAVQEQQILGKKSAEQIEYTESEQRLDFLNEFMRSLTVAQKRNPTILRGIRDLVEGFSALKLSILKTDSAGAIEGTKPLVATTMEEVVTVPENPLMIPVLQTKRVLITENIKYDPDETGESQTSTGFLGPLIVESTEYLDTLGSIPDSMEEEGRLPRWYTVLQQYFQQFPLGDEYDSETGDFQFQRDTEFFRMAVPGTEGLEGLKDIQIVTKKGEIETPMNYKPSDFMEPIQQSYRRGHGPTLRPTGVGTGVAIPGDSAELDSYCLFPYKVASAGAMGAKRPGHLWDVIERSSQPKEWMSRLLEKLRPSDEAPLVDSTQQDVNSVLHFKKESSQKADGNVLPSEIDFTQYLEYILNTLYPTGPGDLNTFKVDLGIQEYEFSTEQAQKIEERVQTLQGRLIAYLNEINTQPPDSGPQENMFESMPGVFQRLADTYVEFRQAVETLGSLTPGYTKLDIAIVAYMLLTIPDYFFAVLSGDRAKIEKEADQLREQTIRQRIQNTYKNMIYQRNLGQLPEVNACPHVKDLDISRRQKDSDLRMKALSLVVKTYMSQSRDGNFYNCRKCKQHFICHHEFLQLRQFLNPAEYLTLQKQIVLNYAGGTFGANHICKNCGLSIAELEFDRRLEFDDEGNPMGGRGQVIDKDASEEEELRLALQVQLKEVNELDFGSETRNEIYKIGKLLCDRLGFELPGSAYERFLFPRGTLAFQTIIPKKPAKLTADQYESVKNRFKIGIVAGLVMLELMIHIPEYTINTSSKSCPFKGLGGWPVEDVENPIDASEHTHFLTYVECTIKEINSDSAPWKGTYTAKDVSDTPSTIRKDLKTIMDKLLAMDVTLQHDIAKKRKYLAHIDELSSRKANETTPQNFLPRMETDSEAKLATAEDRIMNEGISKSGIGPILQADLWIRKANTTARENVLIVEGSPFLETGCCYTENSLRNPGEFWNQQGDLVAPSQRVLQMPYRRQSMLNVHVDYPTLEQFNPQPAEKNKFQLFLNVCYKGEHRGEQHELGYDYKCEWCGLTIPPDYLYPDVDTSGNRLIPYDRIKADLTATIEGGVDTIFPELVRATNERGEFKQYEPADPILSPAFLETIRALNPAPVVDDSVVIEPEGKSQEVVNWATLVEYSVDHLTSELQKGTLTSDVAIVTALEPLTLKQADDTTARSRVNTILNEQYVIQSTDTKGVQSSRTQTINNRGILKQLLTVREKPHTKLEFLRSYFLIPAQKLLSGLEPDNLRFPEKVYKLQNPDFVEVLDGMLESHQQYLSDLLTDYGVGPDHDEIPALAKVKLDVFVKQVYQVLTLANELRLMQTTFTTAVDSIPTLVRQLFLNSLINACILGPLSTLLDDSIPQTEEEVEGGIQLDASSKLFLRQFVNRMVAQYATEQVAYATADVKQKLDELKESEKQRFIKFFDDMTPEQRRVELQKKRLGVGEIWSKGGSKLTYMYDADEWNYNLEQARTSYEFMAGAGANGVFDKGKAPRRSAEADSAYQTDQSGYDTGMGLADGSYGE